MSGKENDVTLSTASAKLSLANVANRAVGDVERKTFPKKSSTLSSRVAWPEEHTRIGLSDDGDGGYTRHKFVANAFAGVSGDDSARHFHFDRGLPFPDCRRANHSAGGNGDAVTVSPLGSFRDLQTRGLPDGNERRRSAKNKPGGFVGNRGRWPKEEARAEGTSDEGAEHAEGTSCTKQTQ